MFVTYYRGLAIYGGAWLAQSLDGLDAKAIDKALRQSSSFKAMIKGQWIRRQSLPAMRKAIRLDA